MAKLKHTYAHFKSIIGRRQVTGVVVQQLAAFKLNEQQLAALDVGLMELNKQLEKLESSLAALQQNVTEDKAKRDEMEEKLRSEISKCLKNIRVHKTDMKIMDYCLEVSGKCIMKHLNQLPQQQ